MSVSAYNPLLHSGAGGHVNAVLLGLLAAAAGGATPADVRLLNGAGATWALYSKWAGEYHRRFPEVAINFQSIGSGGGIKAITERTVDFGTTDFPLTDEETRRAEGIRQIPTAVAAVAIVFNLPATSTLRLTPDALAAIMLGQITRWNHPAIAATNPTARLPDAAIAVAHKSGGSGTTAIFAEYLAKVSAEWKSGPGTGTSVAWPVGIASRSNEGVIAAVREAPGRIGYVERASAMRANVPVAEIRNRNGQFMAPTDHAISVAAERAVTDDYRVSLVDSDTKGAYPIVGMTYLLVYGDIPDVASGEALLNFLWWAFHDGQHLVSDAHYVPLPTGLAARVEMTLRRLTVQGKSVLAASRWARNGQVP